MKIRWTANSLRLRITPAELEALRRGEPISETLCLGDGAWSVEAQRDSVTALTMRGSHCRLTITPDALNRLLAPDAEGVYFQQEGPSTIHYLIEKDFPCSHPRASNAMEPPTETFAAPPDFAERKGMAEKKRP